MALTWHEIESLDLTWEEFEALDLTFGEFDTLTYNQLVDLVNIRLNKAKQLDENDGDYEKYGIKSLIRIIEVLENKMSEMKQEKDISERKATKQFWISIAATVLFTFVGFFLGKYL